MKASIVALVFFMATAVAHADEYYDFYRIKCDDQIPAFEIQRTPFWNIGHIVWPGVCNWKAHVQSLKNLEKSSGLYIFNELYGYYDSPELSFVCGPYNVKINYSKVLRPEDADCGSKEPVRMNATITITSSGLKLAENLPLDSIQRLRVYSDYEHDDYTDVCNSQKCVDNLSRVMGTVTGENLKRLFNK